MTMNKSIYICLVLLLCSLSALAQDEMTGESQYRYDDATQLWRLTNNAAALGLDSTRNRGYAQFNYEHTEGNYSRVQEGDLSNQLRFQTERYQKIGKYLQGYGSFNFDYGRLKNRAWADVMRPYNANPYFAGSSIGGNYDFQDFDFTAALGTTQFGHWRFGVRLDYKVGDLSRLRDPRSRSQLLDYRLSPAVTYTKGKHTLGLSGNYHRRKEKIIGLTTVQKDPNLKYYLMSGMEHANGTVGGYSSYWREWVDHRFGGELTYAYKNGGNQHHASAFIERGAENAYGQYKYESGKYISYRYGLDLRNRIQTDRLLHEVDLHVDFEQAYADEYRQQLNVENEAQTGFTSYSYSNVLIYKKRYQVKVLNLDIHYRANFISENKVNGYVGAHITYNNTKNTHLLPTSSLHYNGSNFTVEGGLPFFGQRLWLDAAATFHLNTTADLSLADPTTEYAQSVLLPDQPYYAANYWRGHLSLTYQFPIRIKQSRSTWFVRAYGDYLRTNNSLNTSTIGVSIGLFN